MAGLDAWWPVHHPYKGVTLIIDFKWKNGIDVPSSVIINCSGNKPGHHAVLGSIEKEQRWTTKEEAVEYGIKEAEVWYDTLEKKGLI